MPRDLARAKAEVSDGKPEKVEVCVRQMLGGGWVVCVPGQRSRVDAEKIRMGQWGGMGPRLG